jgi:hypothetical protein
MARKTIRDFSGGLVSYQSELDISDSQFQEFDNAINTKRGSITKKGTTVQKSDRNTSISPVSTEFTRYRTEKDGSNNDTSTEWWILANADKVYRADVADGTSGSWTAINTYSTFGSEKITDGIAFATSDWGFGTGWSRVVGESDTQALYTTGSGTGALTQTNANMVSSLEKNKIYRLQFTIDAADSPGKAGIEIKNAALTETYVARADYGITTHTVYFSPKESNGGIGFFAEAADGGQTVTFRIDDVSVKEFPCHDLLVHNQILRISDGSFLNDPKWYGHIKRDTFGQGLSLSHYRWRTPPMSTAVNNWYLKDTELVPPVVVPMKYAFDQNNDINAVNEVGIFVYFPDETTLNGDLVDTKLIPDATAGTFSDKDKYTVTFLYDYVQESELARDANGDIGVFAQNAPLASGARCPGIQLVPFTGTSLGSWNERITGINLYWQPEDDVDWYLVTTYDIQDAFSDDPRAKDSTTTDVIRKGITVTSNSGYWIPCLEPYGATTNDTQELDSTHGSHSATTLIGASNWSSGASSAAADKAIIVMHDIADVTSMANFAEGLARTITYIANIKTLSTTTLTTGTSAGTVNWGNWVGQTYTDLASDYHWSHISGFVCSVSTDKVATWYLPNDGLKLATYNSLTGRAAETRLKPIKWNTATVVGNKAFYGNIDFKDENDQTIRERNRIVFTDNFKLDEAVVGTKFVDVGKNDGDEITALHSFQNRLYVFKTRNIYIYRIQSAQSVNFILERHIAGTGCLHKHAVIDTPYGICFADNKQVSLLRGLEISEISLLIRDTYQGLDLQPNSGGLSLGYHSNINTLIVNYDSTATMYAYNFDTQSWSKFDGHSGTFQSQFVMSNDQELQTFDTTSEKVENLFVSTSNDATSTVKLKTKRFDFGLPDQFKRFTKLHITYLGNGGASNLTVKAYIDGNTTESFTQTIADSTTLTTDSFVVNELGKSIEIEISGVASNTRIDGIDIDYDVEGGNP